MNVLETSTLMENSQLFNREFRRVVEDHLTMIKNGCEIASVAPALQYKYHGNFYGLLTTFKDIPKDAYWIVLRCNDYVSPMDFKEGKETILIPDMDNLGTLLNTYMTRKKYRQT